MRQVKSKRSPRTAAVRSGGRVKAVRERSTAPRSSGRRGGKAGDAKRTWFGALGARAMRHPMLALTIGLVVLAACAGLIAGGHISGTFKSIGDSYDRTIASTGLAVGRITIDGESRTPANDVYTASGIQQGQSMLAVDPAGVRARLMQLPWVADAAVKRVFPNTVAITVIEKLPFALWKHDGQTSVVERSGAPIVTANPAEYAQLPVLIGDGAPENSAPLLDAIAGTKAVAARLKVIERVGGRRWNLILDGPVAVKLPEEGWQAEIGVLEKLIVEQGVLEKDIEVIDLRFADRYIFRLRNGDSHESPRQRPT